MTQRATRKDTIQSTSPCTVLAALSAIFSTISFPSVIQSRIEFRRTPPTPRPPAGRNKCTYCSIMRPGIVAGQKFPEKIEHNVHIPFSQDRDRASGYGRTHKCGSERSRNRSDRPLCAECSIVCCVETLEYLFILSLSLSLSLSSLSIFTVHAQATTQTDPQLLPVGFLSHEIRGSAGVPRRGFPKEISNSLTLVSFPRCARLRRSRPSFFSLCRPVFDFTLVATP